MGAMARMLKSTRPALSVATAAAPSERRSWQATRSAHAAHVAAPQPPPHHNAAYGTRSGQLQRFVHRSWMTAYGLPEYHYATSLAKMLVIKKW